MESAGGGLDRERLASFLTRHYGSTGQGVRWDVQPLAGGLEAVAVARVAAEFKDQQGRPRHTSFVVKRLDGVQRREVAVYDLLAASSGLPVPRMLGVDPISPTTSYLFLEWVPWRPWPWGEPALAGRVLERLAHLHMTLPVAAFGGPLATWDYESELLTSARTTLDKLEAAVAADHLAGLRPLVPATRRVVAALPAIRRQLLAADSLGRAVIHGDVHSGNVLIGSDAARRPAVLVDWGRARLGSPLEDVSSWLQSLGYWEPRVRHRRARLLARYLSARGHSTKLGRDLHDAYWLAGACNGLAGALRFELHVATTGHDPWARGRADVVRAVRAHLRVIRRADAIWRQAALREMVTIVKAHDGASPAAPTHLGQAGVPGPESLPARGRDTAQDAEHLVDDARVGDDHHAPARVSSSDPLHHAQDAAAEGAVALPTGPADSIVDLLQMGAPQVGVAPLDLAYQHAFELPAMDLAQ